MFTVSTFGFLLLFFFFSRRPWAKSNSSGSVLGKHAQYGDGAGGQQCSVPIMLFNNFSILHLIRESVDSLCRDGADAQYMQYLSKSRITSTQIR